MTFARLVTFALGHQQQEIDFLIPEGNHGFLDVLEPNEKSTFWLKTKFTVKKAQAFLPRVNE